MNIQPVSQQLLLFLAIVFIVFAVTGAVATSAFGRGRVATGRALLLVVWLAGTVGVAGFGFGQYGLWAAPPAVIAVGMSVAVVYAIARRRSSHCSWLLAAARGCVASILATALLPVLLIVSLMLLGIDGP